MRYVGGVLFAAAAAAAGAPPPPPCTPTYQQISQTGYCAGRLMQRTNGVASAGVCQGVCSSEVECAYVSWTPVAKKNGNSACSRYRAGDCAAQIGDGYTTWKRLSWCPTPPPTPPAPAPPAPPRLPGWHYGWAFESHGGFPPLPPEWQRASYQLKSSTVGYFLGNASGMNSEAELLAETHFGVVGIGWQINMLPSNHSHLEQSEEDTARRLKELRPDVKAVVLRDTQVASVFWDEARARMHDPGTQDYWLQCGGAPCQGAWGPLPGGSVPKYYFNFSNPRLRDWWVYTYIGAALNNSVIDGVYFDCSCNKEPGGHDIQADAQVAFDMALELAAANGKWMSSWNDDGALSPQNCAAQVAGWIELGARAGRTLQVRGERWLSNNTIAAFLIARGPSALIEFPQDGVYYSLATKYGFSPLQDVSFGDPVGPGSETGIKGVFQREWSAATVTLDCNTYTSNFDFKDNARA